MMLAMVAAGGSLLGGRAQCDVTDAWFDAEQCSRLSRRLERTCRLARGVLSGDIKLHPGGQLTGDITAADGPADERPATEGGDPAGRGPSTPQSADRWEPDRSPVYGAVLSATSPQRGRYESIVYNMPFMRRTLRQACPRPSGDRPPGLPPLDLSSLQLTSDEESTPAGEQPRPRVRRRRGRAGGRVVWARAQS